MAEIEPSSRLYEQRRRALHDGQRARAASTTASRRPRRSASSSPTTGWSPSAMRRPSRCAPSPTMSGASPSWRATRRPCWCGCSTRSSTGSPTSSRDVGARDRADLVAHLPARTWTSGESRPTRLTALLTRIGRAQTLLDQDPLLGGQHEPHAELPRRLEPAARRGRRRTLATTSPASPPTSPR